MVFVSVANVPSGDTLCRPFGTLRLALVGLLALPIRPAARACLRAQIRHAALSRICRLSIPISIKLSHLKRKYLINTNIRGYCYGHK